MPMPLLIRADASSQTGVGHVMRCLALAQAWQDQGGSVTFVTAMDAPGIKARLESERAHVIPLADVPGSKNDARRTILLARELNATWLVADGYHFDADYQREVKDAGLNLFWIDDEAHAAYYTADIVLNQNLHATEAMYAQREPFTQLLLGPRYVLLRREFLKWRHWYRETPAVARNILVTLGGGDPENVTLRVIEGLKRMDIRNLEVVVVVGAAYPHHAELEAATRSAPFSIRLEPNVSDMPALMAWADIGVSGGGGTCWELAYLGLPSFAIALAKNQAPTVRALDESGISLAVVSGNRLDSRHFRIAMSGLITNVAVRRAMSRKGKALIDGQGAARVVKHLMDYDSGARHD